VVTLRLALPLYLLSLVLGLIGTTVAVPGLVPSPIDRGWPACSGPDWLNVLIELGVSDVVGRTDQAAIGLST